MVLKNDKVRVLQVSYWYNYIKKLSKQIQMNKENIKNDGITIEAK